MLVELGPVNVVGIIPARYASTRFPGKPLALIAGKPLIQHVVERCAESRLLKEIIVATDDMVVQFGSRTLTWPGGKLLGYEAPAGTATRDVPGNGFSY